MTAGRENFLSLTKEPEEWRVLSLNDTDCLHENVLFAYLYDDEWSDPARTFQLFFSSFFALPFDHETYVYTDCIYVFFFPNG